MKHFISIFSLLIIVQCYLPSFGFGREKQTVFIDSAPRSTFAKIADTLASDGKERKLIVLTFLNSEGRDHKMGNMFAEKLTTELVKQKNFTVLDRVLFSKKLKEHSIDLSSSPDLNYVKKIGELLSVDAVVAGVVTPAAASGFDINARLIDAKTGMILSAEEAFFAD